MNWKNVEGNGRDIFLEGLNKTAMNLGHNNRCSEWYSIREQP